MTFTKEWDIELAARALFESHKTHVTELFDLEWDTLPDDYESGSGVHPLKAKRNYREEVRTTIETLWRNGRLTSNDFRERYSEMMNLAPLIQWDRWMEGDAGAVIVYGWVDREQDDYKDFVLIRFTPFGDNFSSEITTSSAEFTRQLGQALHGTEAAHSDCRRVEDDFPDVKNVVRLAP